MFLCDKNDKKHTHTPDYAVVTMETVGRGEAFLFVRRAHT